MLVPIGLQCATAVTGKRITSGFCSEAEAAEQGYDPVSAAWRWPVLGGLESGWAEVRQAEQGRAELG